MKKRFKQFIACLRAVLMAAIGGTYQLVYKANGYCAYTVSALTFGY